MDTKKEITQIKVIAVNVFGPFNGAEIEDAILAKKKDIEVANLKGIGKKGNKSGSNIPNQFFTKLGKQYPEFISNSDFFAYLKLLQGECIKVYHEAMSTMYLTHVLDIPAVVDTYATTEDKKTGMPRTVRFDTVAYRMAMANLNNSYISLGLMHKCKSNFRVKDLTNYKMSLPTVTSTTFPIPIHANQGFKFEETPYGVVVNIPLVTYTKEKGNIQIQQGIKYIPIKLRINPKDKGTTAELQKILDGVYKITDLHLIPKEGRWRLNITITKKSTITVPAFKKTAGIDIGMAKPIVVGISDGFKRLIIPENEIIAFNRKMEARRRGLTKNNFFKRKGHGKVNKLLPITKLTEKSNNFRKKIIERWALEVANFCVTEKVTHAIMEDLTNIDKSKLLLGKYWNYYGTQKAIEGQLVKRGIEVEYVSPRNSSKTCSCCGELNDHFTFDYRRGNGMPKFVCKKCNSSMNADVNASFVLSRKLHLV